MSTHLEGRPVNASTYTNHKCRCDGCRTAHHQACQESWRRRAEREGCAVDDCDSGVYAKHLCRTHYEKSRRVQPLSLMREPSATSVLSAELGVDYRTLYSATRRTGALDENDTEMVRRAVELSRAAGVSIAAAARVLSVLNAPNEVAA